MEDCPGLVQQHATCRTGMNLFSPEEHARALEQGEDVPRTQPEFPLPIQEVGVGGQTLWILLPQGRIPLTGSVSVDLPPHLRGIHMSRIEEEISRLYETAFEHPAAYAMALAGAVVRRQEGERAQVRLRGQMPLCRATPVSGRTSVDTLHVDAWAEAGRKSGHIRARLGIGVHHITACPCTQAYARAIHPAEDHSLPPATHSQRSFTRLEVATGPGGPGPQDLRSCLDLALHLTQSLLKRPDEAEMVMQAHLQPQFAEDAVRAVAARVPEVLGHLLPPDSTVVVESDSSESIHTHNVRCRLTATVQEIEKNLAGKRPGGSGPT